ncbi:Response regulator [Ignavibacterium album JCM 16511]|uniref:Phosphoenolpyruvate synthase n=1 Tax=Ignavibacterium album (strain DSM 19864 / JCM 16511 / NBRC 101810 / Mat9-16) TaxID=945713 RepID=I0AGA5_IGNAJ|nr:PEP/pyruvate-binding domain-containing protein [Ignavibacterium album]AFH48012.1 Response regulator [Ignavibacterium album JCM 16511]
MNAKEQLEKSPDALWVEHGYGQRFQGFQNLMRLRIRDILLVSSLYDLYLFEEDGRLYELIRNEYQGLNLSHSPELTRVSSGTEAISLAQEESRFDLIITTLHIEDMHPLNFAKLVKKAGLNIPIVLLAHDNKELKYLLINPEINVFDKVFIWQGDFRIIISIIKFLEDRMNVEHDSKIVGVQNVIYIEDDIRYYSSLLPIIYTEMLKQSQRLISEGINLSHKFLRMRARPKILLCSNYEEAKEYFEKYKELCLGIISDIDFPRNGMPDPEAGIKFAAEIKIEMSDIPVLLMSTNPVNQSLAYSVGASFLIKDSPTLIFDLRQFMNQYFSFGDFIFRLPDGTEVGRASDLKQLEEVLKTIPAESIKFHAERNHFSNWLKARTEFWLAHQLRPRKVSDYPTVEDLRKDLINSLHFYRMSRQRGIITDFNKETFDPESSFARIGGGSLGGKARGLGFVNTLINDYNLREQFEEVIIYVPPAVVLGTEVFDQFLDENNLREFALQCDDDSEITKRFIEAEKFPEDVLGDLAAFLQLVHTPLAVRSSSLLEDSQYHPFAGVYETYMIPNNQANPLVRLNDLLMTIKRVYASTFYQAAKNYIKVTSYRLEEEKMAVIIQKMIGSRYENRFYPHISGVAKSYNFYPLPPQKPNDGIVSVALGLGKWVVDGGETIRFCPKYPKDLIQFYSAKDAIDRTQKSFYALKLDDTNRFIETTHDTLVETFDLSVAEKDGALNYVGGTYSKENDVIYDGISRPGVRIVTFGQILKNKTFPLAEIIELLLDMGTWGMGTPVEIEFAINLQPNKDKKREFGLLQMRPLVVHQEVQEFDINSIKKEKILCSSNKVLGNGIINDIYDIVVVDIQKFERAKSREAVQEVAYFNKILLQENRPYLLVGVGRWGSLDPWLGIPVNWSQIAGAKAIVETNFKDMAVEPSQGSHFFQNITSFMIGYFTINDLKEDGYFDWDWILNKPAVEEKQFTKLIRFKNPLTIKMNGQQSKGIILKPEDSIE